MEYENSQMQDQGSDQVEGTRAELDVALASFRQYLQEGTSRLLAATEPVARIGEILDAQVERAQAAAQQAQEALRAIEEARNSIQRDYANLTNLAQQLQQRFAALSAFAQPLDFGTESASLEGSNEEPPTESYNQ